MSLLSQPFLIFELCMLGLVIGFIAGLLGIGGGMMMVPFLLFFLSNLAVPPEVSLKIAIATSMSTIIFTSISSVRSHQKHNAVRWDIVKGLVPGIILGSLISSIGVFSLFKGSTLAFVFEGFVFFSATQLIFNKKPKPSRQIPGMPGMLGAGGVIGFISGLVGAGGGFISVPFMVWCNVSIRNAVGTSAALGFPIALANVIGYVTSGWDVAGRPDGSLGFIWVPGMVLISTCSFLTAPIGAKTAHSLPTKQLSLIFGGILYLVAGSMLYKTLTTG
jgi:uncharacterized membrane protein YfcA